MNPFDPSKLDPKVLMELSGLVQQLPPDKLNRMQSLMHNMMAGFDVRNEMEEFEKTLPAGFREKLVSVMGASGMSGFGGGGMGGAADFGAAGGTQDHAVQDQAIQGQASQDHASHDPATATHDHYDVEPSANMDLHEARLTILRAVAEGNLPPDQAEKLLFPS